MQRIEVSVDGTGYETWVADEAAASGLRERLLEAAPTEIVVTDTVPPQKNVPAGLNVKVLSMAWLIGEAISCIHRNKSISLLFV